MSDAVPRRAICGTTRLYAVLGDPITQVRAPSLVNDLFARRGTDAVLVPVHVTPADLDEVVRGLQRVRNLDGLLVTVPHKIDVCRYADELSAVVQLVGSANILRRCPDGRWLAENFDGTGFVCGLRDQGHEPAGATVAVFGAGGAGRAIATALLTAGVSALALVDPDVTRLTEARQRLQRRWPDRVSVGTTVSLDGVDLAVNATPLGMRPDDPLPFEPCALPPGCLVADIIMRPAETALLRAAVAAGYPVHHGRHMLDNQVRLYERFFGLDEGPTGA